MGMKSKSVGKEGVNRRLTVHQEPKGDEMPSRGAYTETEKQTETRARVHHLLAEPAGLDL